MSEEKKIATGYIGNALRSSAADHTTTFADEIFDTERQQYQNEVNTNLETTDIEIKADLEAESVRATAAEQANAQAITDEVARATAAEGAIIYDVSSHNDGAVFESLSAILSSSNLSTLIPTSVRHGGMTIRFIRGSEQSSDNKYVQFRLMSNVWSTTAADWQGVDDEPTAGSDNLVKSGGVADKISELEEEVGKIISDGNFLLSSLSWQGGYFDIEKERIFPSDTYVVSADFIKGGVKYTIKDNTQNKKFEVVGYDADKQRVAVKWFELITEIDTTAYSYIRISVSDSTPATIVNSGISLFSEDNKGTLTKLQEKTDGLSVGITDFSTSFSGLKLKKGFIDSDGTVTNSNSRAYIDGTIDLSFGDVELGEKTKCYVYAIDDNNAVKRQGWKIKSFSAYDFFVTGVTKYRLMFGKTDDSNINYLEELSFKINKLDDNSVYEHAFSKRNGKDLFIAYNNLAYLFERAGADTGFTIGTYNVQAGDVINYFCQLDNLQDDNFSSIGVRFLYTLNDGSIIFKDRPLQGKEITVDNASSVRISVNITTAKAIDKAVRCVFVATKNDTDNVIESADYNAVIIDADKKPIVGIDKDGNINSNAPIVAKVISADKVVAKSIELPLNEYDGIGNNLEKVEAINDHDKYNDYVYASNGYILRVFNPYKDKGSNLFMGELHCHTYGSTNEQTPERDLATFNAYKELGFDFMTVTNYQNIVTKPSGADGMIWLCNSMEHEFDGWDGMTGEHIILYNADMKFERYANFPFPHTKMQDVLDWAKENNMITSIAHPMWNAAGLFQNKEKLETVNRACTFIEVYNSLVCEQMNTGYSYNEYGLDVMLSNGIRIFGTAVSDTHSSTIVIDHDIPGREKTPGNVKVFAAEKTRKAIWEALLAGRFVACTRTEATIKDVYLDDDAFVVETNTPATITFIGKDGAVIKTESSTTKSSYAFVGNETYVRARVSYGGGSEVYTQAIIVSSKMK